MHFKQNSQVKIPKTIKSNKLSSEPLAGDAFHVDAKINPKLETTFQVKEVGYINCTIEEVDKDAPIESKTEFSILARPFIRDSEMHTGDVTITISKNGNVVESIYTLYYYLNGAWESVVHKRLGAPLTMTEVIDELCWILPSHVNDYTDEETGRFLNFNTHLAEEFTKRIKYFSRHVKLTKRYLVIRALILGDGN